MYVRSSSGSRYTVATDTAVMVSIAAVKRLNRQLAQDVQLLDREIERNSPKQQPARHRYAAAGAPANRRR